MFCPRCTAEFEEGITECPNCGVALEADSPDPAVPYETPGEDADTELAERKLLEVCSTEQEPDCVAKCKELRKAGIPFKVSQHRYMVGRSDASYYKIGVPPEFVDEAKKLIGPEEEDEDDSRDEVPEEYGPETGVDAGEEDDYERREDGNEAKVEVWSGGAEESEGIEAALKENGIRALLEEGEKGNKKVSVAFEHESRAREIVKEIVEGKPE